MDQKQTCTLTEENAGNYACIGYISRKWSESLDDAPFGANVLETQPCLRDVIEAFSFVLFKKAACIHVIEVDGCGISESVSYDVGVSVKGRTQDKTALVLDLVAKRDISYHSTDI